AARGRRRVHRHRRVARPGESRGLPGRGRAAAARMAGSGGSGDHRPPDVAFGSPRRRVLDAGRNAVKFIIGSEAVPVRGETTPERYREVTEQMVLAEAMGFSVVMFSEQHFNRELSSIAQPTAFLAHLAAKTTTVRLRVGSYVLPIEHPLRVAEQAATLDVLS